MSISLLFGCCQVETCARDLDAVRHFMIDILGGRPIEQELARQISDLIPGDEYDVDHIDCGRAVFQVNRPSASMTYAGQRSVHQRNLEARGPCVTNLNYFVDDIEHARSLLTGLGAETHIEGPSSAARALADYGPDNTREGGDERPFLFMGTRHLIGLDLEIMEPNFRHFSRQSVQYPAFVEPRPGDNENDLILNRLVVLVPDLGVVWDNLQAMFAPGSRSKPYAVHQDATLQLFRIGLGGIEIEFVEPAASDTRFSRALANYGPGVTEIAFGTANPGNILDRCEGSGIATYTASEQSSRIASRGIIGFDLVLEAHEEFLNL